MIIENYTITSLLEYLKMSCQYVHYVHYVTCGYVCTVSYRIARQTDSLSLVYLQSTPYIR